jgi:hypothetical protein
MSLKHLSTASLVQLAARKPEHIGKIFDDGRMNASLAEKIAEHGDDDHRKHLLTHHAGKISPYGMRKLVANGSDSFVGHLIDHHFERLRGSEGAMGLVTRHESDENRVKFIRKMCSSSLVSRSIRYERKMELAERGDHTVHHAILDHQEHFPVSILDRVWDNGSKEVKERAVKIINNRTGHS